MPLADVVSASPQQLSTYRAASAYMHRYRCMRRKLQVTPGAGDDHTVPVAVEDHPEQHAPGIVRNSYEILLIWALRRCRRRRVMVGTQKPSEAEPTGKSHDGTSGRVVSRCIADDHRRRPPRRTGRSQSHTSPGAVLPRTICEGRALIQCSAFVLSTVGGQARALGPVHGAHHEVAVAGAHHRRLPAVWLVPYFSPMFTALAGWPGVGPR